jgi:hypothetical protein
MTTVYVAESTSGDQEFKVFLTWESLHAFAIAMVEAEWRFKAADGNGEIAWNMETVRTGGLDVVQDVLVEDWYVTAVEAE